MNGALAAPFSGAISPGANRLRLSALLLFAGVYLVAVATPGPAVAALIARVLGRGLGGIAPFIAGLVAGDLIWFCVAAAGLSVLAHELSGVFVAIKYAGVAYLLFIAWSIWIAPAQSAEFGAPAPGGEGWRAFAGSLALTLGNPKVIVFFLSIMPLAVDLDSIGASSFAQIMATCVIVLTGVMTAYALAANRARNLFGSSRAMRLVNRGAAGAMAGVALAIAAR